MKKVILSLLFVTFAFTQMNAIQKEVIKDQPLKTKIVVHVEKDTGVCYNEGIEYCHEQGVYAGAPNFKPMLWAYMAGCEEQ